MREGKTRDYSFRLLMSIGVTMLIFGLAILWAEWPRVDTAGAGQPQLVAPGCKLKQTIEYTRCGHPVYRRIDAPAEWVGMTQDGVAGRIATGWRMTGFGSDEIEMASAPDLFCPQHWVLMLDTDGTPAIYRNRLGFDMERIGDAGIRTLPEDVREQLAVGLAFDTKEELLDWAEVWKVPQK